MPITVHHHRWGTAITQCVLVLCVGRFFVNILLVTLNEGSVRANMSVVFADGPRASVPEKGISDVCHMEY